jgi:protein-tyrosine-phosphatase
MAAALLAAQPDARPGVVDVASTGLLEAGRQVPDEVLDAMSSRGIDLSGHRSSTLSPAQLAAADLVLGMARRHVHEVVLLDPGSLPHTFRLKEFVRRATGVGPRRDGQSVEEWISAVHGTRDRASLLDREPSDDVVDPYGGPAAGYRATASELEVLVGDLVRLLHPE